MQTWKNCTITTSVYFLNISRVALTVSCYVMLELASFGFVKKVLTEQTKHNFQSLDCFNCVNVNNSNHFEEAEPKIQSDLTKIIERHDNPAQPLNFANFGKKIRRNNAHKQDWVPMTKDIIQHSDLNCRTDVDSRQNLEKKLKMPVSLNRTSNCPNYLKKLYKIMYPGEHEALRMPK